MSRFDRELWKDRVVERFRKVPEGQKRAATRQLARDLDAVNDLAWLVKWCEESGVEVEFDNGRGGRYKDNKININVNMKPERQLHVALHECGHHVIDKRVSDRRFRRGYSELDPTHLKTTAHRIDVLHEELEAWNEGLSLASSIGIYVNRDRYNRSRSEYVKTYLRWVLRSPGYEGGL